MFIRSIDQMANRLINPKVEFGLGLNLQVYDMKNDGLSRTCSSVRY